MDASALDEALDEKYADLAGFVTQHSHAADIVKRFMSSLESDEKKIQLERIINFLEKLKQSSQATPGHQSVSMIANSASFSNQNYQGTVIQVVNLPNAPQSSTDADAQPNPSTHLNFAPAVADPVAGHAQLPQQPVNSQVPKIRLQTPKSETLDKCAKFSVWAVDFLRKKQRTKKCHWII